MYSKYLMGAGAVLALLAAVFWYGHYREGVGYNKRDTLAQIELGERQAAVFEAQSKLDKAIRDADQKNQLAKAETDRLRGDLNATSSKLQKLTEQGIRDRAANQSTGRIDATGPDWIGVFAACYGEYGLLGADAAIAADRLRGLQEVIRAGQ